MAETLVQAAELSKFYRGVRALDGLTCEIQPGATGLLGPNGAGKTTFIKLLMGFLRPTCGTLHAFGIDATRDSARVRLRVGYAPEVESFIPRMNAVDYVAFAGRLSGMPREDALKRAHEVLNYVGLEEARYRPIESFSTGMKQKVKIAQALVHHPRLVVLDEPTTGLDPRGRDEILSLIRDLVYRQSISVLLSTHILHDVDVTCETVMVIHQGRLVTHGPIKNLKGRVEGAYDVRVSGDGTRFCARLQAMGLRPLALENGGWRLTPANGRIDTAAIFRAALETGVQIRHLAPSVVTLDEIFLELVR